MLRPPAGLRVTTGSAKLPGDLGQREVGVKTMWSRKALKYAARLDPHMKGRISAMHPNAIPPATPGILRGLRRGIAALGMLILAASAVVAVASPTASATPASATGGPLVRT